MLLNKYTNALMHDFIHGEDPLTKEELKRAVDLSLQLENDKIYSPDDMSLLMRFLGKMHSLNARSAQQYRYMPPPLEKVQTKAKTLTKQSPIFVNVVDNLRELIEEIKHLKDDEQRKILTKNIFANKNFTGKPQTFPPQIFEEITGPTIKVIYRGFKKESEMMEFLQGDFYISDFECGNGIYFTEHYETASMYACSKSLILKAKIDTGTSKIITNEIAATAMQIDAGEDKYRSFYNVGIYAAMKDYQIIERKEEGVPVYLVLDRRTVKVSTYF